MTPQSSDLLTRLAQARGIDGAAARRPASGFFHAFDGVRLHYLDWAGDPHVALLLHGGRLTARTFDLLALALGDTVRCLALDLRGHGESGWSDDYTIGRMAADVSEFVEHLDAERIHLVGMSLGGLTTIALADHAPELVRRVVLVDVTPKVDGPGAAAIVAFVNGPESFADFDELLARTIEFNPTRSESSLRRGILHNAQQQEDGSWVWRHARGEPRSFEGVPDMGTLWDAVSNITVPVLLCRGMRGDSVITDDDEAELLRRLPDARVERFEHAGHSIQGDMPVELAAAIAAFVP